MQRANEQVLPAGSMDRAEPALPRALRAGGLIAFYLGLVAAWEVLFPIFGVPAYIVPVPSMILKSLHNGIFVGHYLQDLGITLTEMLSGFGIAVVLGVSIGALIVEFQFVEKVIYPLIVALQSLPKIALAPLILIWVGFGIESKITMAALVAFFPMLVNTISGLRAYDHDMHELFRSLSASRWQRLWHLKVPSALPFIIAGLDVSFIFALLGAIVGEFVGSSAGLGYAIVQLQYQFDTAGVFAILVLLAVIGVTGHTIIGWLGRRAAFWQASGSRDRR